MRECAERVDLLLQQMRQPGLTALFYGGPRPADLAVGTTETELVLNGLCRKLHKVFVAVFPCLLRSGFIESDGIPSAETWRRGIGNRNNPKCWQPVVQNVLVLQRLRRAQ